MAPGVLATPREVEDAIGPGLCRGRRGLVHAAGRLKCPWRCVKAGTQPQVCWPPNASSGPLAGPHPAALLHTRGAGAPPGLPGACVSSSGIYGALTVCLTVLDVGEGANDTHNLSATYGLTGRVRTSWGQGGALESPTGPRSRASRKASEVPGPPGSLNPRVEARVLGLQTNCRSWVIQMGWRLHVLTLRGINHFRSRVWSGRAFWRRRSSSLRGCVLGDGAGLLQSRRAESPGAGQEAGGVLAGASDAGPRGLLFILVTSADCASTVLAPFPTLGTQQRVGSWGGALRLSIKQ